MGEPADATAPDDQGGDLELEAAELRAAIAAHSRARAVRLARVSRLVFALGVVLLVVLVLVWVLGVVATSDAGFRVLALAVVVLLGLAFLTGALSAAAAKRA